MSYDSILKEWEEQFWKERGVDNFSTLVELKAKAYDLGMCYQRLQRDIEIIAKKIIELEDKIGEKQTKYKYDKGTWTGDPDSTETVVIPT
jgi:hypothetical protein